MLSGSHTVSTLHCVVASTIFELVLVISFFLEGAIYENILYPTASTFSLDSLLPKLLFVFSLNQYEAAGYTLIFTLLLNLRLPGAEGLGTNAACARRLPVICTCSGWRSPGSHSLHREPGG